MCEIFYTSQFKNILPDTSRNIFFGSPVQPGNTDKIFHSFQIEKFFLEMKRFDERNRSDINKIGLTFPRIAIVAVYY